MAPICVQSVLISESVDPRCRDILQQNGIRVTERPNMKKDELIAEIKVKFALRNGAVRGRVRSLPTNVCRTAQVPSAG